MEDEDGIDVDDRKPMNFTVTRAEDLEFFGKSVTYENITSQTFDFTLNEWTGLDRDTGRMVSRRIRCVVPPGGRLRLPAAYAKAVQQVAHGIVVGGAAPLLLVVEPVPQRASLHPALIPTVESGPSLRAIGPDAIRAAIQGAVARSEAGTSDPILLAARRKAVAP